MSTQCFNPNVQKVYDIVTTNGGPINESELLKRTGFKSVLTLRSCCQRLIKAGLIYETSAPR